MERLRALVVALAIGMSLRATAAHGISLPPNFVDDVVVSGLNQPNAMAFLPDGRLLITELESGKIRMVVNGQIAAIDPAFVVDSVSTDGYERGLQGIAVDPRWPAYPYVYVCHTIHGSRMRLVRYTAFGDLNNPVGQSVILGAKRVLLHDLRDQVNNHNGLGLRFGTDGKLLMTTGDDEDRCSAQLTNVLRGKLLRIDVTRIPAGAGGPPAKWALIPSDNPIASPDSNARLVYAYGFRNPWRFQVDALTGKIVVGDVGESSYEEIDIVTPGGNYGWPFREGPMTRSAACTEPGGYTAPMLSLDRATGFASILVAGIYRPVSGATSPWPSVYNGSLFYADYINSRIRRMVPSGQTWVPAPAIPGQPNSSDWATGTYYAVDFAQGKDGSLWWLRAYNDGGSANSGSVRRIRYASTTAVDDLVPATGRLLTAAPNPFRDRVDIAWRLPTAGKVTIALYDIGGRHLRDLDGAGEAAEGRVTWDGLDHRGEATPPGIYLARLVHPGGAHVLRLMRVR